MRRIYYEDLADVRGEGKQPQVRRPLRRRASGPHLISPFTKIGLG
jgi:hypothetical protein